MTTRGGYMREALFATVVEQRGHATLTALRLVQCADGKTVAILHQEAGSRLEDVDDVLTLETEEEAHDMFFEQWASFRDDEDDGIVPMYTDGPPPDARGMARRLVSEVLGYQDDQPDGMARLLEALTKGQPKPTEMVVDEGMGYGMYL